MKRYLVALYACAFGLFPATAAIAQYAVRVPSSKVLTLYPHWTTKQLPYMQETEIATHIQRLEDFIAAHKSNPKKAAVFDWDGTAMGERTLLDRTTVETLTGTELGTIIKQPEKHRAMQIAWQSWSAAQVIRGSWGDHQALFPSYISNGPRRLRPTIHARNVMRMNDYLEAMFAEAPPNVPKFLLHSSMEEGMSIGAFYSYFDRFLQDQNGYYDPCKYAIFPTLDVIQRLRNEGFEIWVVTGSNSNVVAGLVRELQQNRHDNPNCKYANENYDFGLLRTCNKHSYGCTFNPETDRIVGHGPKYNGYRFSHAYDDQFFLARTEEQKVADEKSEKIHVVADEGKAVAIERFIEGKWGHEVLFMGSNSGGDAAMAEYVLRKRGKGLNVLSLSVNPRGKELLEVNDKYEKDVLKIKYDEFTGVGYFKHK